MEPSALPRCYIICPGSVTGDLWHLAAAQISANKYSNQKYVTVIVISGQKGSDTNSERWKQYTYGEVTFNYLRQLKLDCVLVKMDKETAKGTVEAFMYGLKDDWFDAALERQRKDINDIKLFSDVSGRPAVELHDPINSTGDGIAYPLLKKRVLTLTTATAIVTDLLLDKRDRCTEVAKAMYAPNAPKVADGDAKYKQLCAFKDGKSRLFLENYRRGAVNTQTDSNEYIAKYFSQTIAKYFPDAKKVYIAATKDDKTYADLKEIADEKKKDTKGSVLDFYNRELKAEYPGLDPHAQARFWRLVAEDTDIIGLFGGRSGSVDLAGFCGVRVLFWDEPWLEADCQITENNLVTQWSKGKIDDAYSQTGQCLRSLQLACFMSVAYPVGTPNPADPWRSIREAPMKEWMNSLKECEDKKNPGKMMPGLIKKTICPLAPDFTKWDLLNSVDEYRAAFIHRPFLGVNSFLLETMKYKAANQGKGLWQRAPLANQEALKKYEQGKVLKFNTGDTGK